MIYKAGPDHDAVVKAALLVESATVDQNVKVAQLEIFSLSTLKIAMVLNKVEKKLQPY